MAQAQTSDLEALQTDLRDYLEQVDRAGDPERIAQRLARKQSLGSHVVGFRRHGREVLLYEEPASGPNGLYIHEISLDGHLPRIGTVWKGRDLDQWLREHCFYLDWVHPDFRS